MMTRFDELTQAMPSGLVASALGVGRAKLALYRAGLWTCGWPDVRRLALARLFWAWDRLVPGRQPGRTTPFSLMLRHERECPSVSRQLHEMHMKDSGEIRIRGTPC
jgi:hypothetical protein